MNKPISITPVARFELPDLREVWEYRDLLYYLVLRDLKIRFQQTSIGVLWIVLQPLIQMAIFYVIFGLLVRVPTGDVPYSVFYLSGFVIWQLLLQIVNLCGFSLLTNVSILTKIYFPKLVLPISYSIGALIDFFFAFIVLLVFLLANNYAITLRFLLIPLLLIITLIFCFGVGLLFGALMVVFRDMKNLLGFITQIWMFLTPIMYPISLAPDKYKFIFYLNPVTGLIETFRWIVLNSPEFPDPRMLILSIIVAVILLVLGLFFFRAMENRIADVM